MFEELTGAQWLTAEQWTLRPDTDPAQVPPAWLEFACWIAIGYMKHGANHDYLNANAIFDGGDELRRALRPWIAREEPERYFALREESVTEPITRL